MRIDKRFDKQFMELTFWPLAAGAAAAVGAELIMVAVLLALVRYFGG